MDSALLGPLSVAIREVGRTVRFVVASSDRTVNLITLTIIFVIIWYYFL